MKFLRTKFNRAATAVVLTSAVAAGAVLQNTSSDEISALTAGDTNASVSDSCIVAGRQDNLNTPERKRLTALFNKASQSEMGREILAGAVRDKTVICFDKKLDERDKCGFYTLGLYSAFYDLVKLNPNVDEDKLILVMIHEARHKQQTDMGLNSYARGNFSPEDRVIMNWVKEADARVASIVFAYQMHQKGHPQLLQNLSREGGHRHMVDAFMKSLKNSPGDVQAAMGEAVKAFRTHPTLTMNYDKRVVEWMQKYSSTLKTGAGPDKEEMLSDTKLDRLGQVGKDLNYMTEDLKSFIRGSYTKQDLDRHINAVENAKKTNTSVCKI